MNALMRVITIPGEIKTAVTAALLFLMVQLELWLGSLLNISFEGVFQPVAAVLAVILVVLAKKLLEWIVPERLHSLVDSVLVWLAGYLGATVLLTL